MLEGTVHILLMLPGLQRPLAPNSIHVNEPILDRGNWYCFGEILTSKASCHDRQLVSDWGISIDSQVYVNENARDDHPVHHFKVRPLDQIALL